MKTNLFSKITIASIITASILFTGCGNKEDAKVIKPAKTVKSAEVEKTEKMIEKALNEKPSDKKEEVIPTYTKYDSVVQEVFKDVAKVAPDGKQIQIHILID
jgi:outer membrane murein-binding lipoprotein Lpp